MIESFAECLFNRGQLYSRKESVKLLTFLLDAQSELFEQPKCLENLVKCRIEVAEKEKVFVLFFDGNNFRFVSVLDQFHGRIDRKCDLLRTNIAAFIRSSSVERFSSSIVRIIRQYDKRFQRIDCRKKETIEKS